MEETDMVNHPPHYNCYEHEVIELTSQLDFCMGNVAKYILRADHKGRKAEDLKKALWYLEYLLDNTPEDVLNCQCRMCNDKQFADLVTSYGCALLDTVLNDPENEGWTALKLAIKDAEIEELKAQLAKEQAKPRPREGLSDKDWGEINKIFRQADELFKDSFGRDNLGYWRITS